jgi:hypothetical protein
MLRSLTKKSDPTDILLFLVIVFFLAISLSVTLFANQKIQNLISSTALNESTAYSQINESFSSINQFVAQRAFTLFFGILIIGILVSSFLVRVHPVFIFIYIITLGVTIFVSIYLANAYALMVSNSQLAEISANFAMMTWIMQNVTRILLAVGALSMIIIFGKIGGGTSGQSDI